MTWSPMLAGILSAGANSKPHNYKQRLQKIGGLPENMGFKEKQCEDFRQKKQQKQYSGLFKKNPLEHTTRMYNN